MIKSFRFVSETIESDHIFGGHFSPKNTPTIRCPEHRSKSGKVINVQEHFCRAMVHGKLFVS